MICWGGNLGNSIFILITGYFMVKSHVNWKKIFVLLVTMFFYSWFIMAIIYGGQFLPFSWKQAVKEIFPILFGENWFVSCYIIFSVFIPFINHFLNSLNKEQYQKYLILFFLFSTLLPAFTFVTFFDARILFFLLSYSIGGYLKLFGSSFLTMKWHRKYGLCFFTMLIFLWITILSADGLGILFKKYTLMRYAYHGEAVFTLPMAISIFCFFLTRPYFYCRNINIIAGTVLGVYLIHENSLMRQIIWNCILPNMEWISSPYYPIFYLVKVLGVFMICSLIEFLRKKLLDKTFDKAWYCIKNACFKIRN